MMARLTNVAARRRRESIRILVVLVAALCVATTTARADDEGDFLDLQGRRAWTGFADARPVSPYFGTPGEHAPGVPFSRAYIDSTPGRAEAFAAFYYPSEILEEGVLETTKAYKNPTMARVNNPDVGRGTKGELAPLGPAGPRAKADTPTRTDAASESRSGVGTDAFTVAAGWGRTQTHFNREDLLVDEAVSTVEGLQLGDTVRIASMESSIRLEYRLNQEPQLSYRLQLSGVEAGDRSIVGVGAQGITLSGQQVAAKDLAEQFNAQADQYGKTFAEVAARATLHLVQPRVQKQDDGSYLVTGAALEARSDNKPFRAGGGDNTGLRLGSVKVYAYLLNLQGASSPAASAGADTTGTTPPPTGTVPAADLAAGSGPGSRIVPIAPPHPVSAPGLDAVRRTAPLGSVWGVRRGAFSWIPAL